jgi:purine nucleosidase
MPRKIILDTDPGVDDTLAILLALRSPELQVLGMTSVFGNGPAARTARNALRVLEAAGRVDVPVAIGADRPLVRPPRPVPVHVHGRDGQGDAGLPEPSGTPIATPAAAFIVEQVRAHPGEITLVALGPLTNLALALALDPAVAGGVQAVVFMGGTLTAPGNVSPVAEANIHSDPEAAEAVLAAPWPVTMVGLDVTCQTITPRAYLESLGHEPTSVGQLLRGIFPVYQAYHADRYGLAGGTFTHDPSAVAYLLQPGLFHTEQWPLFVETQGRSAGQVIADRGGQWPERPAHTVCLGVDSAGVLDLLHERMTGRIWGRGPSEE